MTAKITNPSLEIQDTKVIVHERLGELEKQLSTLTNSPQPKTKKAQEKRQASILDLTRSIDNFKAYLSLSIEQKVTDGNQLGIITDLSLSRGGLPEVWVSWYNHVPIPEQAIRLKPEPFFKQLKVGDSVTINSNHPESGQQTFEIKEFRGEGWIFTTTEQLFHHDFIEKIPNLEEETVSEMVDESSEKSEIIDENEQEISTTIVEVVQSSNLTDTDELTDDEVRDRLHLERKVERAFYEAGKALKEIRDRKLYRSTHKTFEEYCLERFGFTRMAASYKIAAAKVIDNLSTNGLQSGNDEMSTNGLQSLETEMRTNGLQTEIDGVCPDGLQTDSDNLSTNGLQNEPEEMSTNGLQSEMAKMTTNGHQILPTSERQVRPLTKLEPGATQKCRIGQT